MKRSELITKKDFLVVVCCTVFLLFNLGIIGGGARMRAKEALCLSNLFQWGQMYSMYANDNDGKLMDWNVYAWYDDEFVEYAWIPMMYDYAKSFDIYLCPTANATWTLGGVFSSSYTAWDFGYFDPEWHPYYFINGQAAYGSYGKNTWITDSPGWSLEDWSYPTVYIANANEVPLFGDSSWCGGFPSVTDEPAQTLFHSPVDAGINRWNIARHGLSVNMLFLDWSARKVGLRELWMLKWSRQEGWGDTAIVPDPDDPSDWPEWMRD
jgi:prepilin-type processing-associated H-X9-DG protein